MSDGVPNASAAEAAEAEAAGQPGGPKLPAPNPNGNRAWRARLRRFILHHVPLALGGAAALLTLLLIALYFYAGSASFQNTARERLAVSLGRLTGGRVEIASFHWRLLDLEAEAGGVVIHGREAAGEAPYARIQRIRVEMRVLGFFSPRILVRNLVIDGPELHWIVYPDGTTNQPEPARKRKPGESAIDRLFDLEAGRIVVEHGVFDYDNRAARFDFEDRRIPLDFTASDATLRMSYVPAGSSLGPAGASPGQASAPESYLIDLGATDLSLSRGAGIAAESAVHGRVTATIGLTRDAVILRQLRLAARSSGGQQHVLDISGVLRDFRHPSWQMRMNGELDMRLLEPVTGYPYAPEGLARLNLAADGNAASFELNGRVRVVGGAYVGTGVMARGIGLDANVHADPYELRITNIVARFRQGGLMEGVVDLTHWLPPSENAAGLEAAPAEARVQRRRSFFRRRRTQAAKTILPSESAPEGTIPVDGNVTAQLRDVSLDTILDMVSEPEFQRLGIAALLNGPATATWTKGDSKTVVVSAALSMNPPSPGAFAGGMPGEAPASGTIDATYAQSNGSVDVRKLKLNLPESAIAANGRLGAYPMSSPTQLTVSFQSRDLNEFDAVLRDLGLKRLRRTGAAALPVKVAGQANFDGTWAGSLVRPKISGAVHASGLSIEMPEQDEHGQPRFVNFDSVEADGSYSGARIAIANAMFARGAERVTASGMLDAFSSVPASARAAKRVERGFGRDSLLHASVRVENLNIGDLQPLLEIKLPATGLLDAHFEAHGPLHAAGGEGFATLKAGSLYGEPVSQASARGFFENGTLKLAAVQIRTGGGTISGAGSFDFASRRFEFSAHGGSLELARVEHLRHSPVPIAGKLRFRVEASGTPEDPHLNGTAAVSELNAGGESLGGLNVTAHSRGDALFYDARTLLAGTELNLHGETALQGDYITSDRIEFSQLDVGAFLKLAHVEQISGRSALAGTITVSGPLARPRLLRGEASLNNLAVTLAGVHLEGPRGAHATLADGRIHLDPLHITGENTDLNAEGSLEIGGARSFELTTSGAINLKLAETLDPDVTASGETTFAVKAHGTVDNPGFTGQIQFQDGAISLEDLPNGLSHMHGVLEFNQNRLEVRQLTAMTGGGLLSLGGFIAYRHGIYVNLTVAGKGVRIRYPQGISSLADANLRLQGSPNNLLLGGNVLITRFAASSDLDLEVLAAQANSASQSVTPPNAPTNHVRLDIHLISSPQLNFQNAFAKLAGDVNLRLRGTLASPSVLGQVSITDGSATIAGTRYELQRGDISFTNPVRIDPVIDLTASAHVQDYDITLGLHGSPQHPTVTYRSDPPLAEADVVSLLALGHTQDQERLYTQQQEQELANPSTSALLGGALNATMSSRVQKLFGAGSVKVDPDYLGAFGNATSRITVQEQVGRTVTLTYATDVNTTGQQLLQAEIAVNRHVSLVVARDEAGVFSMVLKATRRYK